MIESARRHSKNRKLFFFYYKIKKDVMSCFSFSLPLLLLLPCVTIANHGTPFLSKNKSCQRQLGGKKELGSAPRKLCPAAPSI